MFGAMAMGVLRCGSRNAYNGLRGEPKLSDNFSNSFGVKLPHGDAIDDFLRELAPERLEEAIACQVRTLLARKKLRGHRIQDKWYAIAVDATGIATYDKRHCDRCLTRKLKNGNVLYFHYVLEAKLVTSDGLCISIASEFIENIAGRDFDKQDCELKAFKRLAAKLKRHFPRLPICVLADGLYPNSTVFDICRNNGWKFAITLKDGSLPTFQEEAGLLRGLAKSCESIHADRQKRILCAFQWMNDVDYAGNSYSWLSCRETVADTDGVVLKETKFVYITNIEFSAVDAIAVVGHARLRWKIENEGFNTQKNHGYGLEHKYSRVSYNAMRNYYLVLQLAHLVNQLLVRVREVASLLACHSKTTLAHLWKLLTAYLMFVEHGRQYMKLE